MGTQEIIREYSSAGWFPLQLNGKVCVNRGVTGNYKSNLTPAQLAAIPEGSNIGVRTPKRLIGIDVDSYKGTGLFDEMIATYGPLPIGPASTSKTDGKSAIYYFLVPSGTKVISEIKGANVELIQNTHRYATVYPSVHPETGAQYNWYVGSYTTGLQYTGQIPVIDRDIPELPEAWLQFLTKAVEVKKKAQKKSVSVANNSSFLSRVAAFAELSEGIRNDVMKDLARDGRWYELGGKMADGESFDLIVDAAKDNGLVTEEGLRTIEYRINHSRKYAERTFDETKVGNPDSGRFDKQALMAWNDAVQAAPSTGPIGLSDQVKFAAQCILSYAIENEFWYVAMSSRLLAHLTGVSAATANGYLHKLAAKGWIELTAGTNSYTPGKKAKTSTLTFKMDQVTIAPKAELISDVTEIVQQYTNTDTETIEVEIAVEELAVEEKYDKISAESKKPHYEEGAGWLARLLTERKTNGNVLLED